MEIWIHYRYVCSSPEFPSVLYLAVRTIASGSLYVWDPQRCRQMLYRQHEDVSTHFSMSENHCVCHLNGACTRLYRLMLLSVRFLVVPIVSLYHSILAWCNTCINVYQCKR
jgi:hypothetical protein